MIFSFVRSLIGNFGRALMDFYINNGLLINGIILFYALLVFIAHRNYLIALEKIIIELRASNDNLQDKKIEKIIDSQYNNIRWGEVKKVIWFPFISEPKKWIFSVCTINYLKTEFSLEKINQILSRKDKNI